MTGAILFGGRIQKKTFQKIQPFEKKSHLESFIDSIERKYQLFFRVPNGSPRKRAYIHQTPEP